MSRPRRRGASRSSRRARPGGRRGASRGGSRRNLAITSASPTGNITTSSPMVRATVKDGGTTLSKSDIYVYLDGEEIERFQYRRSTGSLSFSTRRLSSGAHTVEIEASAGEGGRNVRKSWSFAVK